VALQANRPRGAAVVDDDCLVGLEALQADLHWVACLPIPESNVIACLVVMLMLLLVHPCTVFFVVFFFPEIILLGLACLEVLGYWAS
jgi:hypothetical protein